MSLKLSSFVRLATAVAAIGSIAGCQSALNSYAEATYDPDQIIPMDTSTKEYMYSFYRSVNCSALASTLAKTQSKSMSNYAAVMTEVMEEKKCGAEQASVTETQPVAQVLDKPLAAPSQASTDSKGKLGAYLQKTGKVTPKLAQALGMPTPRGVLITGTNVGGAAEAGGLKSLDVILAADDVAYDSSEALRAYIATLSVGHPLKLTLWRHRAKQTLVVKLGSTATPLSVAEDAPGYCYVSASSSAPGVISWRSSIFAVSVSTSSSLQERGKAVSALFRSYLLQNVSSAQVGETIVGICNAGLSNVASIWKADVASTEGPAYQSLGGETVDLVWKP